MKTAILALVVLLGGCASQPTLTFRPTEHTSVWFLCETYDKLFDDRVRYHCNGKKLVQYYIRF